MISQWLRGGGNEPLNPLAPRVKAPSGRQRTQLPSSQKKTPAGAALSKGNGNKRQGAGPEMKRRLGSRSRNVDFCLSKGGKIGPRVESGEERLTKKEPGLESFDLLNNVTNRSFLFERKIKVLNPCARLGDKKKKKRSEKKGEEGTCYGELFTYLNRASKGGASIGQGLKHPRPTGTHSAEGRNFKRVRSSSRHRLAVDASVYGGETEKKCCSRKRHSSGSLPK